MLNKIKWLILFALLLNSNLQSQNTVSLKGIVTDSINNPISLATVMTINKNTEAMYSYCITDNKGLFNVKLRRDSAYILVISYIGYAPFEEEISLSSNGYKQFTIKQTNIALDEVTATYKLPVKVSGDTVTYNVESFTNGTEKKLKDVIKKLPGFEVDNDGTVKVEGKKVDKITVEGKDFFAGDSKLATKNIPANVVDKINLLRNYNEYAPLKQFGEDEKLVIDVRLKDDKKNILFGTTEIAGGFQERYLLNPNLFYFNPKTSINFIGDLNNIGNKTFSFNDILRFNGGIANAGNKSGSSMGFSPDMIGFSELLNNQAQSSSAGLGALSYSFYPSKKIELSGFAIYTNSETNIYSTQSRTYIKDNNNKEELVSDINTKDNSGIFQLTSKITPNRRFSFKHAILLKGAQINEAKLYNSEFQDINNEINTTVEKEPTSLIQNIKSYYSINNENMILVEASHRYLKERNLFDLASNNPMFVSSIPLIDSQNIDMLQFIQTKTSSLEGTLNYYYLINNTSHIKVMGGIMWHDQYLSSNISQAIGNDTYQTFTQDSLLNNVRYNTNDVYSGLSYITKLKKVTLTFGGKYHLFNILDDQLKQEKTRKKALFLPDFKLRYDIKKTRIFTLNYAANTEFVDINKVASAKIINGYNTIYKGNRNLTNSLYHDLSFDFYEFNTFNFSYLYALLSFQKKYKDVQNNISYQDLNVISTPIIIDQPSDVLTSYVYYEKKFKNIKPSVTLTHSYLNYGSLLNNKAVNNTVFTQNYILSLEFILKKILILEVGFEKGINSYDNTTFGTQKYIRNMPFGVVEVNFLKSFLFTAKYEYEEYINITENTKNHFELLSANLYYKLNDTNWEFKITGLNILNNKSIKKDSFSSNLVSTSQYFIQPRYFLFSVIFTI